MSKTKTTATQSITLSDNSGLYARYEIRTDVDGEPSNSNIANSFNNQAFKNLVDAFSSIRFATPVTPDVPIEIVTKEGRRG